MAKSKYKAIKADGTKHDYHRWLMEQEIGRKLDRQEVVHHINGNPLDNDIGNLRIMSLSEHSRMHATGKKRSVESREKQSQARSGMPNSWARKLSEDEVAYIREYYTPCDKEYGARALSRKFSVNHQTILRIIKGETYKRSI